MNPSFPKELGAPDAPPGGAVEEAGVVTAPRDLETQPADLTAMASSRDLALVADMTAAAAPDATVASDLAPPPASVVCGMLTCSGTEGWCCLNPPAFTHRCVATEEGCDSLIKCDGQEDCGDHKLCCGNLGDHWIQGTACAASCTSTETPLCHHADASDCPTGQGFAHCCPILESGYSYCSKTPC